jgi:hypothetical protein
MQKLDDELHRSFIVVMKDYLEIAGLGVNIAFNIALNIAHGIISFKLFVISACRSGSRRQARTKQEQCHYPNV